MMGKAISISKQELTRGLSFQHQLQAYCLNIFIQSQACYARIPCSHRIPSFVESHSLNSADDMSQPPVPEVRFKIVSC